MTLARVELQHAVDFTGWRAAARDLLAADVAPEDVTWSVATAVPDLFAAGAESPPSAPTSTQRVPRAFVALARQLILHRDPQRFALLYRLLWRLRAQPRLLQVAMDEDVARAMALAQAVRRDVHKMKAFVRFREVVGDEPCYVAWFEPAHHIVEATAPFFARRFATRRWAILTPEVCAHWDGEELSFAPGATRADAPSEDQLETLWRSYYASIFNPARLKLAAMRAQMPQKYWRNLPEARLIPTLSAAAAPRAAAMMAVRAPPPRRPRRASPASPHEAPPAGDGLAAARAAAAHCSACSLYRAATQTVFGEGPATARILLLGEQPGDQEDLRGRPFIGPAGQLLDDALAEAGIVRDTVYVTNAVKHFKFEPRGKRRLHKRPSPAEVAACEQWLALELQLVQPEIVIALGATAARALFKKPIIVGEVRGRLLPLAPNLRCLVTVHPSYVLRLPDVARVDEYARFVADLRIAAGKT